MKTFENQGKLAQLPLPTLEETLSKYLETIRPFLEDHDFLAYSKTVQDFQTGIGPTLQQRLLDRCSTCQKHLPWSPSYTSSNINTPINTPIDAPTTTATTTTNTTTTNTTTTNTTTTNTTTTNTTTTNTTTTTRSSWLIDWWNEYSYLRYREPLVINVSFFFVFPLQCGSMISRAAQIAFHAVQFKTNLVKNDLEPDMMRDVALCMNQYHFLFNSCRVPQIPCDTVKLYDPSNHHHIVVCRRNNYYMLPMLKDEHVLYSIDEIETQLAWIIKDADKLGDAPTIGILTADHRDSWSKNYILLSQSSKENSYFLEMIQSSSFLLCLDTATPITRDEIASLCWHGYGNNRWFDKSLQFIVFQNGRAGFIGEHSMMDATTPARLCDYICEQSKDSTATLKRSLSSKSLSAKAKKLYLNLQPTSTSDSSTILLAEIEKARVNLMREIKNHDVQTLNYTKYGKGMIKLAGVSPDSFVQMGIQLAYFKLMGTFVATYESAGMRRYEWGRTETCRSVSSESVEFCKAMEDPKLSSEEKCQFAKEAINAHSNYMAECLKGRGIDRHFLGLRLSLKPDEPMPAFFLDPIYNLACHWTLSTSQIPTEYFEGYGWGEVVPDGFGVAYMVRENRLMFNIAGLVGDVVPDLEEHMHHDTVETTSIVPVREFSALSMSSTDEFGYVLEQSKPYFLEHYKDMRVKWFKACLEEAFDDLYNVFSTSQKESEKKESAKSSVKPKLVPSSSDEKPTSYATPRPASIKAVSSTSNVGLSLAYPSRRAEMEGVIGEDVGLIEFEIGWGEQRRRDPEDEAQSTYSRKKKLIKWPWSS